MSPGRTRDLANALAALRFIASQRAAFDVHDLARGCEVSPRTAYRWIGALLAHRVIEPQRQRRGSVGGTYLPRVVLMERSAA